MYKGNYEGLHRRIKMNRDNFIYAAIITGSLDLIRDLPEGDEIDMCEERKEGEKQEKKTPEIDVDAMVDNHVQKALKALEQFMDMTQEQVDKIVEAMTVAGQENHTRLAKMAVEETGRGVYEDKIIKNMFATEYIWHSIKNEKTVGIVEENELEGYVEIAEPVGVVAAATPVTNPTSTTCLLYTSPSPRD